MKPYQFSKKAGAAKIDVKRAIEKEPKQPEEVQTPIQGIMPDSVQEWRAAKALDRMKLEYDYQYSIGGGTAFRGGQVVDFWVYTQPLPTPLFIQGTYWHRPEKQAADKLKVAQIMRYTKGQVNEAVMVPEEELGSVDEAYATLRRRLLRV